MKPFPSRLDLVALLTLIGLGAGITGVGLARGEADPAISVRGATAHAVTIRQLRFEPSGLRVAPGDTVVWINRDIVPHTVAPVDESWSSGEMNQNDSFRWIVDEAGQLEYFCQYHPGMHGVIDAK